MWAPNARRAGVRSASTARIATVAARFARAKTTIRSAVVIELLDQRLQPGDVLRPQLAGFREAVDERRQLAAEHAVEEALALGGEIVVAGDERTVAHAARLAHRFQRPLLQQPTDQRLDGGVAPALRGRGLGD